MLLYTSLGIDGGSLLVRSDSHGSRSSEKRFAHHPAWKLRKIALIVLIMVDAGFVNIV